MEIKQASSYDLIDILFLLKQCILEMNKKGLKQWNSANPGPEIIKEDIEKGNLYLLTETNIAQGMITLSDEIPEDYKEIHWKGKSEKVLYIKRFAVHPFWQDSDVSEKLMNFAEQYAKDNKYSSIRLDILDSIPADEKFFSVRNFEHAGDFHTAFQKMPYVCFEKNL